MGPGGWWWWGAGGVVVVVEDVGKCAERSQSGSCREEFVLGSARRL